jgi:hypothetical protein
MLTGSSGQQIPAATANAPRPKPPAIKRVQKTYQRSGSEFTERLFAAVAESTDQFGRFLDYDDDGRAKVEPMRQYWNILAYVKQYAKHAITRELILLLLAEVTGRMIVDAWFAEERSKFKHPACSREGKKDHSN